MQSPGYPTAPVVGTRTQPTCAVPTGSVVLSGLPSSGTWTLTRNPGAVTYTGTGSAITVSTLAPGTYTFTVTNASGCVSPATANVVINASPTGSDSTCCGNKNPAYLCCTNRQCSSQRSACIRNMDTYKKPGSSDFTGTGTSTTVSNLAPGTYTFTVTRCLRMCFSMQPAMW